MYVGVKTKTYGDDIIRKKHIRCFIVLGIIWGSLLLLLHLSVSKLGTEVTELTDKVNDLIQEKQAASSKPTTNRAFTYTPIAYSEINEGSDAYDCYLEIQNETLSMPTYLDIPLSYELQDYTIGLSEEFCVPHDLIFSMMFHESAFRANIISSTNDYGIMQINRINHRWLTNEHGITNFLCVEQSILSGIIIISSLIEKYEDLHKALMAYNMGEAGARRHWNQGTYTSTYSRKIINTMNGYIQQRQDIQQT